MLRQLLYPSPAPFTAAARFPSGNRAVASFSTTVCAIGIHRLRLHHLEFMMSNALRSVLLLSLTLLGSLALTAAEPLKVAYSDWPGWVAFAGSRMPG